MSGGTAGPGARGAFLLQFSEESIIAVFLTLKIIYDNAEKGRISI